MNLLPFYKTLFLKHEYVLCKLTAKFNYFQQLMNSFSSLLAKQATYKDKVFNLSGLVCFLMHFVYLFGVLCHFQHCTRHITTGSWKGRGNQYIQFARVL